MRKFVSSVFMFLLPAVVLVAMTGTAEARPPYAVNTGNSCEGCHATPPQGSFRQGALAVTGTSIIDLGTELDGHVRGPLQAFTVVQGGTVDLTLDILDGHKVYAVELKRLEKSGQRNNVGNFLSAGAGYVPDPVWFPQGPMPNTYYTSVNFDGTTWTSGPVSYTFTLTVDPATPVDAYDLEFAVAGKDDGGVRFYSDMHFYVDVVAPPNQPPIVDPGGPYSGVVGQPVQFDASGTVDPDGDSPLSYVWAYTTSDNPPVPVGNSGGPSELPTTSFTFTAPGTYIAEVAVGDFINDPVIGSVEVVITEAPAEDIWLIQIPFLSQTFTASIEPFAGFLIVRTEDLNDGSTSIALGMEFGGVIFWMDITGAIYFGNIDHALGHMSGVVFGGPAGSGLWIGDQL